MVDTSWASEVSPHIGLFNRDFHVVYIYMYIYMYVCRFVYGKQKIRMPKCVGGNTGPNTRMLKVSFGQLKPTCDTRTEERRLRIRREKDRARRRTKKLQEEKKRSSETEDQQCLATLKRLKRGDEKL